MWLNYDGNKTSSWRCDCHAISEAAHKAGLRPNLLINCSGTVIYGGRDVFKACLKSINTFSTIVKHFWGSVCPVTSLQTQKFVLHKSFLLCIWFYWNKVENSLSWQLRHFRLFGHKTRRDLICVLWCTNCDRIRRLHVTQKRMVQRNRPQQTS